MSSYKKTFGLYRAALKINYGGLLLPARRYAMFFACVLPRIIIYRNNGIRANSKLFEFYLHEPNAQKLS
jgi:hypothetical protein